VKRQALILIGILLVVAGAVRAFAGPLTAGSYTYFLQGRELEVPVDILVVRGAPLLPEELLGILGIKPVLAGDRLSLTRGPVTVQLALGSDTARAEGRQLILAVAPMLVSGRVFVPAEVLPWVGFSLEVEGKFVLIRDYAAGNRDAGVPAETVSLASLWAARTVQNQIRSSSGAYGQVTVTVLTPELLSEDGVRMPWGTRQRLLSMLDSRTLLLVTLRNDSQRALSFEPARLLLTDPDGRQYDYLQAEIAIEGRVTGMLAPGAVRTSVLTYELSTGSLTFFYEPNGDTLGRVIRP
jgi:hypothetical protein